MGGEKEKGRMTERRNPVAVDSGEDLEMEMGVGTRKPGNDKRKERSPETEEPPGNC
jgi:hypothetical protein